MFIIKKDPIEYNAKYTVRRKDTSVVYVREDSKSLDALRVKVHMNPTRNTRHVVNNAILDLIIQTIRNNGPFDEFEILDFGSDVKETCKLKRQYIEENIQYLKEV